MNKRPFLVIPRLIEQPTWGGLYIAQFKGIDSSFLRDKKFGQSYELSGSSVLSLADSTVDRHFKDDLVALNAPEADLTTQDSIQLSELVSQNPKEILGPQVKNSTMPLLIKFTQALGNSFQLHIPKSFSSSYWRPKPESWYYLEDGLITFGIKKGTDLMAYKTVCLVIDEKMKELSSSVISKKISLQEAKTQANLFIKKQNPWQFVNVHRIKKHTVVDLSQGGLHHSWEEDALGFPLGNVVYEVQLDVPDDSSTIRSFDKGKFFPDGSIRKIHIDDYFAAINTKPEKNDLSLALRKKTGNCLLQTTHYSLDLLSIQKETMQNTTTSFVHLFVLEGEGVEVETQNQTIVVGRGYSCFIPFATSAFSLSPVEEKTLVLKTYISG